jgi:hypothetical protein
MSVTVTSSACGGSRTPTPIASTPSSCWPCTRRWASRADGLLQRENLIRACSRASAPPLIGF